MTPQPQEVEPARRRRHASRKFALTEFVPCKAVSALQQVVGGILTKLGLPAPQEGRSKSTGRRG